MMGDEKKKADFLSRVFMNSGNVIDHDRVRLTDSTPVNSTGLQRLMHDNSVRAILGLTTIAGALSPENPYIALVNFLASSTYLTLNRAYYNNRYRRYFGNNYRDLCINKNPDQDVTTKPEHISASYDVSLSSKFDGFVNLGVGYMTFAGMTLPTVVLDGENIVKFARVHSGKYAIEDTPPPEKKPLFVFEPEPSFA